MSFQPLEHDEFVSDARTGRDLFWLKTAVAAIQKNELSSTRLEDSRSRNHELASQARFHIDIYEHARLQLEARVRHRQPYTHGACRHIHLGQDLFNLAGECSAGIRIDGNLCGIAGLHAADVVLEYLRVNPDTRKIGN